MRSWLILAGSIQTHLLELCPLVTSAPSELIQPLLKLPLDFVLQHHRLEYSTEPAAALEIVLHHYQHCYYWRWPRLAFYLHYVALLLLFTFSAVGALILLSLDLAA